MTNAQLQDRLFTMQKQYGNLLALANKVASTQPEAAKGLRAQAQVILAEVNRLRAELARREGTPSIVERAAVATTEAGRDLIVGAGRVVGDATQGILQPVVTSLKPLFLPLAIGLATLLFLKSGGVRRKF